VCDSIAPRSFDDYGSWIASKYDSYSSIRNSRTVRLPQMPREIISFHTSHMSSHPHNLSTTPIPPTPAHSIQTLTSPSPSRRNHHHHHLAFFHSFSHSLTHTYPNPPNAPVLNPIKK
jgi:hypothetical protein